MEFSSTKYAVVDDTTALTVDENGKVTETIKGIVKVVSTITFRVSTADGLYKTVTQ